MLFMCKNHMGTSLFGVVQKEGKNNKDFASALTSLVLLCFGRGHHISLYKPLFGNRVLQRNGSPVPLPQFRRFPV